MSFKVYKDNRAVPPIIAFITICLLWTLIDPSASSSNATRLAVANQDRVGKQDTEKILQKQETYKGAEGGSGLDSDSVLLILKTGATVLWRRLPIHLSTTLSPQRINPKNTVVYSDINAKIGNHTAIDILAELPPSVKDSPDFELYHATRDWDDANYYIEQTGLPGDEEGPPGGWRLDKYKFLPLIQHAGTHWPDVKWYLYTEDDTYMFLPNVLLYLSKYDHRESHWLGGLGEKLGTTFAHGGSGFALSRAAWEQSFGTGGDLVKKYQGFVDEACCGDYALGKVLNDFGVRFGENHGDEKWSWGFNGLPHWKIEFSRDNWCKPVLTWHHAHNRDIARYYELEQSWDFTVSAPQTAKVSKSVMIHADPLPGQRPLNYGDFYANMIAPSLVRRKGWWDNLSSRYQVTSTTVSSASRPDGLSESLWTSAWKSVDSCEAACRGWSDCVQWYYYGDDCKMDDRVFMGHGWPQGMRYRKDKLESVSGWLTERINTWKCDVGTGKVK